MKFMHNINIKFAFSDYTDFLEDLEEDPQYRLNINIYKGNTMCSVLGRATA